MIRLSLYGMIILFSPFGVESAGAQTFSGRPVRSSPAAGVPAQISPAQIAAGYAAAKARHQTALSLITSIPSAQRTFANTVRAFESAEAAFSEESTPLLFLAYVSPDEAVRAAAVEVEKQAEMDSIEVWSRPELYQAMKDFSARGEALEGEDQRLLDFTLRGFKEQGLHLQEEKKVELRRVQERLSELEIQFASNIREHKDSLEVSADDLDGLPADYAEGLEKTPEGKYLVTLDYPSYLPFMQYAKNGELRRQLHLKYQNRATERNVPILEEALSLRHKAAGLLDYPSYAHRALDNNRMAKEPGKVKAFLERLRALVTERGRAEIADLLAVKKQSDPGASRIEPWELSYYSNILRRARYDLDPEEVKQYFPVERVVEGTLAIYQELLGLRFEEEKGAEVWHPEVKKYRIFDKESGRSIGTFFLDLFPRPGKHNHFAAFGLIQGRVLDDGSYREPLSAMVANFSKPTPGKPSLLKHGDVETFFHEFGHIMHQTLTTARHATLSGSRVARDFVEAPSQMMENFVWTKEVLDRLSGHYQDPSRKLPPELLEKMLASKRYNQALHYLGQIAYASIDLALHIGLPGDTTALFLRMMEEIGLIPAAPGAHPQAGFGHLLGGYGAGYYGYLWSEVFAADVFSRFRKEGLLSPEVGVAYRRAILERGGSRPEIDSLREFLGREPNEDEFLEELSPPEGRKGAGTPR